MGGFLITVRLSSVSELEVLLRTARAQVGQDLWLFRADLELLTCALNPAIAMMMALGYQTPILCYWH